MTSPTALLAAVAATLFALPTHAEGPYRNPDNKSVYDAGEGSYPVQYKKPTVAEITASLDRIRGYMEATTPTKVIHKDSGIQITDFSKPVADAIEGLRDSFMSIPPDTLLDTLLLANHLTPIKSPLQEPQRDLPPHSDSAIDLFIDEQKLASMLEEAKRDAAEMSAALLV